MQVREIKEQIYKLCLDSNYHLSYDPESKAANMTHFYLESVQKITKMFKPEQEVLRLIIYFFFYRNFVYCQQCQKRKKMILSEKFCSKELDILSTWITWMSTHWKEFKIIQIKFFFDRNPTTKKMLHAMALTPKERKKYMQKVCIKLKKKQDYLKKSR